MENEQTSEDYAVGVLVKLYPDIPLDAIVPVVKFRERLLGWHELSHKLTLEDLSKFLCHMANQRITRIKAGDRTTSPYDIIMNAAHAELFPLYQLNEHVKIHDTLSKTLMWRANIGNSKIV